MLEAISGGHNLTMISKSLFKVVRLAKRKEMYLLKRPCIHGNGQMVHGRESMSIMLGHFFIVIDANSK